MALTCMQRSSKSWCGSRECNMLKMRMSVMSLFSGRLEANEIWMFFLLSAWPSLSHLVRVGHMSSRYFFTHAGLLQSKEAGERLIRGWSLR